MEDMPLGLGGLREERGFQIVEMNEEIQVSHFPICTPVCGSTHANHTGLGVARLAGLRGLQLLPENSGSCFKQPLGNITLGEWGFNCKEVEGPNGRQGTGQRALESHAEELYHVKVRPRVGWR